MLTSEKKQGQPPNLENTVQGALTDVAKNDGVGAFFLFFSFLSFPSFFLSSLCETFAPLL